MQVQVQVCVCECVSVCVCSSVLVDYAVFHGRWLAVWGVLWGDEEYHVYVCCVCDTYCIDLQCCLIFLGCLTFDQEAKHYFWASLHCDTCREASQTWHLL